MHSRAVKCWPILDFYGEQSMSHYPREISQFRAISHMDELHNLEFGDSINDQTLKIRLIR